MGKKRNLNGLPNNLVQRYFSSLFYWKTGTMADWIWYSAEEMSIIDIEIDIIKKTVKPKEMEIEAITAQLPELRETISRTLKSNCFDDKFIIEAKIYIYISQKNKSLKLLSGTGKLKDVDGKIYEGKPITEKAYKKPFYSLPKNEIKRKHIETAKQIPKWWQFWK